MITGIIGFLCLAAAVALGHQDFGFHSGNLILGEVLVLLPVGIFCWLKFFPESGVDRQLITQNAVSKLGEVDHELLHRTGMFISQLRPSAAAFLNGKRVDVISERARLTGARRSELLASKEGAWWSKRTSICSG